MVFSKSAELPGHLGLDSSHHHLVPVCISSSSPLLAPTATNRVLSPWSPLFCTTHVNRSPAVWPSFTQRHGSEVRPRRGICLFFPFYRRVVAHRVAESVPRLMASWVVPTLGCEPSLILLSEPEPRSYPEHSIAPQPIRSRVLPFDLLNPFAPVSLSPHPSPVSAIFLLDQGSCRPLFPLSSFPHSAESSCF